MPTLSFKPSLWIGMSIILCFALVLSACGPASSPAASRATSIPVGNQALVSQSSTPTPAEDPADTQQEYTNQDFGFSLSYPKGYEVYQTFAHSLTFLGPQGTPGHRGRGWLQVERILDQDARWFADQERQGIANLVGLHIDSSVSVIDGQQAYVLGRMPGQDFTRQVFIVYKGFLYHLSFVPDDPQLGAAYQQMETLYSVLLPILPQRKYYPGFGEGLGTAEQR